MLKRLWSDYRNACLLTLAIFVIGIVVSPWVLIAALLPIGWVVLKGNPAKEDQPLTITEETETMSELPKDWAELDDEEIYAKLDQLDKSFKQIKEEGIDDQAIHAFEILSKKERFKDRIASNKSTPSHVLLNIINELTNNIFTAFEPNYIAHAIPCMNTITYYT